MIRKQIITSAMLACLGLGAITPTLSAVEVQPITLEQTAKEIDNFIYNKNLNNQQKEKELRKVLIKYNQEAINFSELKVHNLYTQLKHIYMNPIYNKRMSTSAYCRLTAASEAILRGFSSGGTTGTAAFKWCIAHGYN